MKATRDASVIIPTWNGADLLASTLTALERQSFGDFETIVVDNGSTDGTPALLERDYPDVRAIRLPENRGFAAAVNAGIRAATGEAIVLLNNDAEPEPEWLAALLAELDRHPEAGSAASKMLSFDQRDRIDSAGDEWHLFAYPIGHGQPDSERFDTARWVFSACAGAAAYRQEALDQVGLFDERFFAFLEDVDLGIRLQLAGWRCRYSPDAVVYHHGSATARRLPERKLYLLMRNSLYLFFQYNPVGTLLLWTPAVLGWPFVRVLRERRPLSLAWRAVRHALGDWRAIRRRRRESSGLARRGPTRTGEVADRTRRVWFAPPGQRAVLRAARRAVAPAREASWSA